MIIIVSASLVTMISGCDNTPQNFIKYSSDTEAGADDSIVVYEQIDTVSTDSIVKDVPKDSSKVDTSYVDSADTVVASPKTPPCNLENMNPKEIFDQLQTELSKMHEQKILALDSLTLNGLFRILDDEELKSGVFVQILRQNHDVNILSKDSGVPWWALWVVGIVCLLFGAFLAWFVVPKIVSIIRNKQLEAKKSYVKMEQISVKKNDDFLKAFIIKKEV